MKSLCLVLPLLATATAFAASPAILFDGKTLDGWEGDMNLWHVKDGIITAGSADKKQPRNEFLSTKESYGDFELHLKFKLEGDPKTGFVNSGVQFRSVRHADGHEMIGYQADLGDPKFWGALYDESRRKKTLAEPDMTKVEPVLKRNDWNDYTIICRGPNIKIILNGLTTVDYTEEDKSIPQTGKIGLQIHGGANTTVSFKDIMIAVFK
ncbi:MAG TPA: DUF1080 domain-containing protein [Verrucomicrobiaceae bacterium]